jgi:hypothetical protein
MNERAEPRSAAQRAPQRPSAAPATGAAGRQIHAAASYHRLYNPYAMPNRQVATITPKLASSNSNSILLYLRGWPASS